MFIRHSFLKKKKTVEEYEEYKVWPYISLTPLLFSLASLASTLPSRKKKKEKNPSKFPLAKYYYHARRRDRNNHDRVTSCHRRFSKESLVARKESLTYATGIAPFRSRKPITTAESSCLHLSEYHRRERFAIFQIRCRYTVFIYTSLVKKKSPAAFSSSSSSSSPPLLFPSIATRLDSFNASAKKKEWRHRETFLLIHFYKNDGNKSTFYSHILYLE